MRRLLSILTLLSLLFIGTASAALAADSADTAWFYDSQGGEYSISTAAELLGLAEIVSGGYTFQGETISLTADIDLSGIEWTPIGGDSEKVYLDVDSQEALDTAIAEHWIIYDDSGNSYSGSTGAYSKYHSGDLPYSEDASYYYVDGGLFSGAFDGRGHTISGLNVLTELGYAGLFGKVDGILRDFTVSGAVTYSGVNGDYIGGVAGMLAEGGVISGVTSNVNVYAKGAWNVGGIVGFVGTPLSGESANNTTVSMCANNGSVLGSKKVGGIAGENAGVVELCVNRGAVDGYSTSNNGVGGIVGRNGNNNLAIERGTVINCYNTGEINSTRSSAIKWSGGVVGFNNCYSSIINCYSITIPVIVSDYVNPIAGKNEASGITGVAKNNYSLSGLGYSASTAVAGTRGTVLSAGELTAAAYQLGGAYRTDPEGGYPKLLWELESSAVTFSVSGADGYSILVTDSLGVPVAPEADGYTFLLVNGETYDYDVSADGCGPKTGSLTAAGDETIPVELREAVGPVVTLNNNTAAAVRGVENRKDYAAGELTFTVECDKACFVAYSTDGGAAYTRLSAQASGSGGYDFTIDLSKDMENVELAIVLKGDLNLNGTVNGADALQTQRAAVGLLTLTPLQELAADVNGNGSVNGADALQIQRSVVGLTAFDW